MFNLIIAIISIALVVGLIAATMYTGGDYMSRGQVEANAARIVNEAQQIKGAVMRHTIDNQGQVVTTLEDLAPKYLSAVPKGWETTVPVTNLASHVVTPVVGATVSEQQMSCIKANIRLGVQKESALADPANPESPPLCDSVSAGFIGCCVVQQ